MTNSSGYLDHRKVEDGQQSSLLMESVREYSSESRTPLHLTPTSHAYDEKHSNKSSVSDPGSKSFAFSSDKRRRSSENSGFKAVFAENSELLNKHAVTKRLMIENGGGPTLSENPFNAKSPSHLSDKESIIPSSVSSDHSQTTKSSRDIPTTQIETSATKDNREVTEEDKKRYLAFLDEFHHANDLHDKEDVVVKVNEPSSSIESGNIYSTSTKTHHFSKEMGMLHGYSYTNSLSDHSPGRVYTILEVEDEAGSPTTSDGVSRPRNISKISFAFHRIVCLVISF